MNEKKFINTRFSFNSIVHFKQKHIIKPSNLISFIKTVRFVFNVFPMIIR